MAPATPILSAGTWYPFTLPAASLTPYNFLHLVPNWLPTLSNFTKLQYFISYREPVMGDIQLEKAWQNKVGQGAGVAIVSIRNNRSLWQPVASHVQGPYQHSAQHAGGGSGTCWAHPLAPNT